MSGTVSEGTRTQATTLLRACGLLAIYLAMVLAKGGCSQKGVPGPAGSDAPTVEAAAPDSNGQTQSDDAPTETASEVPKRKGTRVTGGLPPIRRADLISGITVPGGERFILGGGQPSSFYCDVENQGETEVMVTSTRGSGASVVARLKPGDSASHRFQPTEAAVIANLDSLEPAILRLRVWGDTNLGMRYEPGRP